jgi:hypothetical protein
VQPGGWRISAPAAVSFISGAQTQSGRLCLKGSKSRALSIGYHYRQFTERS